MESWSKGIFESMRDEMMEEIKKEMDKENYKELYKESYKEAYIKAYIKAYKEGCEEVTAIFTLFADGKSDEDVLEAFPELTSTKVEKMRQQFGELKNRMNRGS